jgi:hypothetical protein
MRRKRLAGIAHDLAYHISHEMWFGYWKNLPKKVNTDALNQKTNFEKMVVNFFKERLPKTFKFEKIEKIKVLINRTMGSHTVTIKVKINGEELKYSVKSSMY